MLTQAVRSPYPLGVFQNFCESNTGKLYQTAASCMHVLAHRVGIAGVKADKMSNSAIPELCV